MKGAFGLLALAGLTIASPLEKRQSLDLDAYHAIPTASPLAAPVGVTATQATTSYDPSAAASAAASAATTVLTVVDQASPTETSVALVAKRNTVVGNNTLCSVAVTPGNAPVTSPDTPQDFVKNMLYANASLNAVTPIGYSPVWINKLGSASDPSYLTYTTANMNNYNITACANICTNMSGCFSFNIYYERDPGYVIDSKNCTNPTSVVYIKCALYSGPLTALEATNTGQWRGNYFQVVIAGSNAYSRVAPPSIPGWTGPVTLGNASINAPYSYIGVQTFPQTQPFDPSICAAACAQTTIYDDLHINNNGLYDTCRFFDAYVLYENGQNGVFTCAYYTLPWGSPYATNIGQYDAKGNHYTIGHSYTYAINTELGTVGTGLAYYTYTNPYKLIWEFPTLSPFQGANYIETGLIQNPSSITLDSNNYCTLPGQSNSELCDVIGVVFQGFFVVPTTGSYTFATPRVDDMWYMWHGDTALSGWNGTNYDTAAEGFWASSSYTITLSKGYILPVTFLWTNNAGPGYINFQVTFPNGTIVTDTTGLFTPPSTTNNPFKFSSSTSTAAGACAIPTPLSEGFENGFTYSTDPGDWSFILPSNPINPSDVSLWDASHTSTHSGNNVIAVTHSIANTFLELARTIPVCPNTVYYYSAWIKDPTNSGLCDSSLRVDNMEIASLTGGGSLTSSWVRVTGHFNSGSRSSVKFGLDSFCRFVNTIVWDDVLMSTTPF